MWSNTDCKAVSELLWNYTSHRLAIEDVERVERHLDACGACRAEAESYRQTVDAMAAMRRGQTPESRRGWRDLEARLSQMPQRKSLFPPIWFGMPGLAWGGAAATVVLCVLFLPQLREMSEPAATATAHITTPRSANTLARSSEGPLNDGTADAADLETTLEAMSMSQPNEATRRVRTEPRAAHGAIRWSPAGASSGHTHLASLRSGRTRSRFVDYRHMDGNGRQPSSVDGNDYVLTPVSASSDSDTGAQYVMGSLVMAGRSDDTEVARGW